MNNFRINTRVRRLFQYLEDFELGRIKVPPFQRDFEWNNRQKLDLLDSLKSGFPIGSVLFWQAKDENLFIESRDQKVGAYFLPNFKNDSFYILDGYQRLSTLFGCFIDPNKTALRRDDVEWKKSFDIVYNLHEDQFEFNRKTHTELPIFQIPLFHFIDGEKFYDFQTKLIEKNISENLKKKYIQLYKNFGAIISGYDLPSIDLVGASVKEAVEIFSRLNSRGKVITNDWKVSALSFSNERNFRLGTEIDYLFERLERYNFFYKKSDRKSKRDLILKCIISAFGKIYFDVSNVSNDLEQLARRSDFIDISRKTLGSIEKAVKFLYEEILILDSILLPYNNHLIFITEFFNHVVNPSRTQLNKLKTWFWQTTYSNYFTIYNLAKQRIAYDHFMNFVHNENLNPIYFDKEKKLESLDFPLKISMKSVRSKALTLFMLNFSLYQFNILSSDNLNKDKILTYSDLKIFSNFPKHDSKNIPENTIFYIVDRSLIDNRELKDFIGERYFISNDMKNMESDLFLSKRLTKIKKNEKLFVERLDLIYSLGPNFLDFI